jgi:hypothetical protein
VATYRADGQPCDLYSVGPAAQPYRPPGSKQRKNNEGLSHRQSRDVAGYRVGVMTHEGYCLLPRTRSPSG